MVAGRRIRFTAVLVAVVFALTGFSSHGGSSSSGSGGKSKGSSSSSGGGCSSSKSKKKKSHSSKSSSSPTASASPTSAPARAVLVDCVGADKKGATVQVISTVDAERTVRVPVTFSGANGAALDAGSLKVTLKARESRTVVVPMTVPGKAAEVKNCRVGTVDRA
ncbi:hypothetical protein PV721_36185 [Streptomyces sp. MB09-01]|uniref:hypothetical protein n=1 Tax=Streptomyces sp. MB09-01 TaxID=3028666 RepID=UPI0029B3D578|nr:hypothetical protein [Streptomyces sp. MB09-01]MDX3539673.1 hypothetical protein [Streptomyces sp. MB09-01]